ncbi:unnamed protein product [Camellia sinensis]
MADPTIDEKHKKNREIYEALLRGKGNRVIELFKQVPKGPLHVLTMHQDTVLHMATFSEQQDIVSNLLRELPEENTDISSRSNMMLLVTVKNDWGNTVLHDAATSNKLIPVAREMLRREPELLMKRNRSGETALARAARYGMLEMFKFLDGEVNKALASKDEEERVAFYERNDKATILHGSVIAEHFQHQYLVNAKDGNGMTALQLLACNPSAFEIGTKHYLKRLINF